VNHQNGYVRDNEFVVGEYDDGLIDTMYINSINPIVDFPSQGQYVWGQKTLQATSTAMDRVNVARLMAYIRYELARITRPFIFEPNDAQTRQEVSTLIEQFLTDIVDKRGIQDFIVQADENNNPPSVIDRNEMVASVMIAPTKSMEFLYIPIRLVNTGEI
jgi:phage tail sheath protein FI